MTSLSIMENTLCSITFQTQCYSYFLIWASPEMRNLPLHLFKYHAATSKRKPDIWAIHSCGHDNQVFGCLKRMGCETNSEKFFISTMLKKSIHDNLCQRNKIFRELHRSFKYFKNSR